MGGLIKKIINGILTPIIIDFHIEKVNGLFYIDFQYKPLLWFTYWKTYTDKSFETSDEAAMFAFMYIENMEEQIWKN